MCTNPSDCRQTTDIESTGGLSEITAIVQLIATSCLPNSHMPEFDCTPCFQEEEVVDEQEAGPSSGNGQSAKKGKKNKISIALGKSKLECHVGPPTPPYPSLPCSPSGMLSSKCHALS